jgi:hypothetical protein
MENIKSTFFEKLGRLFSILFQLVLFLFLASLLLREFYPKLMNSYIDLSWFLLFIIVFGVLTLVFPTQYMEGVEKQIISREFIFMVLLGTMIGYNIFLRLKGAGLLGIYISVLCGIGVFGMFALILIKKRKGTQNTKKEE